MAEQVQLGSADWWYLHLDGDALVWNNDPSGAVVRLLSSGRAQVSRIVENVYERNIDGQWQQAPVDDLKPWEMGNIFYASSITRQGQRLSRFESVRLLSETDAKKLLMGLVVRDEQGDILPSPDTAGRVFLLSARDADEFVQRIGARKEDGWFVFPRAADPNSLQQAAQAIIDDEILLAKLVGAVEGRFQQLASGDGAGIAQLDEVASKIWTIQDRVRKNEAELDREIGALGAIGASSQELVEGQKLQQRALDAVSLVHTHLETFRAQQVRAAALIASKQRSQAADMPAAVWISHVQQLLRQLATQGVNGWIEDGTLVIEDQQGQHVRIDLPS